MVSKAAAIPVGTLIGLAMVMLIFIWWWFPRHYQKGIRRDMEHAQNERAEMDMAIAQLREEGTSVTAPGAPTEPEKAYLPGEAPREKTADERLWELVAVHRQVLKNRHEAGQTPAGL